MFLDLCLQDGVMETAQVREERKSRPPIIKEDAEVEIIRGTDKKQISESTHQNGNTVANEKPSNGDVRKSEPEPEVPSKKGRKKLSEYFNQSASKEKLRRNPISSQKVSACMLKTFNRMKKRIGFLIYQFVLPALQVITLL